MGKEGSVVYWPTRFNSVKPNLQRQRRVVQHIPAIEYFKRFFQVQIQPVSASYFPRDNYYSHAPLQPTTPDQPHSSPQRTGPTAHPSNPSSGTHLVAKQYPQ